MEGEPFERRLSRADMLRLAALAAGAGVVAGPAAAADAAVARLTKESGVDTKALYQLFPKGPAKKAARIAGLPKPKGCI